MTNWTLITNHSQNKSPENRNGAIFVVELITILIVRLVFFVFLSIELLLCRCVCICQFSWKNCISCNRQCWCYREQLKSANNCTLLHLPPLPISYSPFSNGNIIVIDCLFYSALSTVCSTAQCCYWLFFILCRCSALLFFSNSLQLLRCWQGQIAYTVDGHFFFSNYKWVNIKMNLLVHVIY